MGTTVTTHLSLIKPDDDESIKENLPTFAGWADQNADNCDTIDALFRATNSTWTPTITATGGGFALGAGGSFVGKHLRAYPRMTIGYFTISMGGAGFAAGTGAYNMVLPHAPAAEFSQLQDSVPIGKAFLFDADNVLTTDVLAVLYSSATGTGFFRPPNGGSMTGTSPITLAQNDRIQGYFMYPTSAA